MKHLSANSAVLRGSSLLVAASLLVPIIAGCGSPAPAPTQSQAPAARPQSAGLSTKQKVVLLAGAAALYYYYNRSKKANEAKLRGQQVQYYLSKSTGRVYFRDPNNPQKVTWVTPPPSQAPTFRLPESEVAQYRDFQGYDNAQSGKELSDVFTVR